VLSNQLNRVLPDIISPAQSAFVPGRLITDNILLAYELTHHLNQRKWERNWVAVIKLDMSKAYDQVEWHFLDMMMFKLGFTEQWVSRVMKCVTSLRYHIKINGEYTTHIIPQKGLHQGDSLSPYLFILCAEGLSTMLEKAEMDVKIKSIRVCREAPHINHLFFADDSLILMWAHKNDGQELRRILVVFEKASGQVINRVNHLLYSAQTLRERIVME
jgi:hypothetical protein